MNQIFFGNIDAKELKINTAELSSRLMSPDDFVCKDIEEITKQILLSIRPRYCYAKTSVLVNEESLVTMDFTSVYSQSLARSLKDCDEAIVMAVTLGIEADIFINRMSTLSPARGFMADAILSALAESAADYTCDVIKGSYTNLRQRFSPGYGDLILESQRNVLGFLWADRHLGIKLGENLLMTPHKSITAICGLERNG